MVAAGGIYLHVQPLTRLQYSEKLENDLKMKKT
jgi:hypothetical protein